MKYTKFRGDTFYKKITAPGYTFQKGDILRVAILNDAVSCYKLYENEIIVDEEKDAIIIEISKTEMAKLPTGILILEFELTYSGIVKTEQFELEIKADGIRG